MILLIVNGMVIIKCFKYIGIIILVVFMSNIMLILRELIFKDLNKKVI